MTAALSLPALLAAPCGGGMPTTTEACACPSPEVFAGLLDIRRADLGQSRLVLDGIGLYNGDDSAPVWPANPARGRAVDEVVLEDLVGLRRSEQPRRAGWDLLYWG